MAASSPPPRLDRVSIWKAAYLIHGDDHGRISERRASLRRKAEEEAGANGVEVFEGDASNPVAVAAGLQAMTFAMGHRFLVVEGVERWKESDVKTHLTPVMKTMPADTTVAFFGRDDGRTKTPAALADAVKKAGGVTATETTLKAKDLPRWAVTEATKLGVELDGAAARELVDAVGERQQRLLRELEKLAIEHGPGARLGVEEVEAAAAPSAERQVWSLVDALVARDRIGATRAYLELRGQGESLPRLVPLMARRLREVLAIAVLLEDGQSPNQIKAVIKGSPWMVDKRIKEARNTDADVLRRALEALANLELASRGMAELGEDTAALRTIDIIAA
jgi:DNA polymerase-3 subunit delta